MPIKKATVEVDFYDVGELGQPDDSLEEGAIADGVSEFDVDGDGGLSQRLFNSMDRVTAQAPAASRCTMVRLSPMRSSSPSRRPVTKAQGRLEVRCTFSTMRRVMCGVASTLP